MTVTWLFLVIVHQIHHRQPDICEVTVIQPSESKYQDRTQDNTSCPTQQPSSLQILHIVFLDCPALYFPWFIKSRKVYLYELKSCFSNGYAPSI